MVLCNWKTYFLLNGWLNTHVKVITWCFFYPRAAVIYCHNLCVLPWRGGSFRPAWGLSCLTGSSLWLHGGSVPRGPVMYRDVVGQSPMSGVKQCYESREKASMGSPPVLHGAAVPGGQWMAQSRGRAEEPSSSGLQHGTMPSGGTFRAACAVAPMRGATWFPAHPGRSRTLSSPLPVSRSWRITKPHPSTGALSWGSSLNPTQIRKSLLHPPYIGSWNCSGEFTDSLKSATQQEDEVHKAQTCSPAHETETVNPGMYQVMKLPFQNVPNIPPKTQVGPAAASDQED